MTSFYICNSCKVEQPVDNFFVMKSGEVKRRCSSCKNGQKKVIRKLRRQVAYPFAGGSAELPNWFSGRVHKYTYSPEYKCPICTITMPELLEKKQDKCKVWVLDHCHHTETFRGWLCHNCNSAIGSLQDDSNNTLRATNYLVSHKETLNEGNDRH
jgi:hypothetical protein